jgi:hypothetical protein
VRTVGMALPKDDAAGNATWHPSQWEGWDDNESDEDIPQVCGCVGGGGMRWGGRGGFGFRQTDRQTHTHTHTQLSRIHMHARPRARRKGLFVTHTHTHTHTHTSGSNTQAHPFKNPRTATSEAKRDFSSSDDHNLDLSGEEDAQEERAGSRGGGRGTEGDSSGERDSRKVDAYV